jgi:TonB family protein
MARTSGGRRYGPSALALVAGCWLGIVPVAGQVPAGDADPVFLETRRAVKFVLKSEKPEYPPLAKVNYIQGKVRVQVVVTREGSVQEAHVVRGHPFLAVAALQAVRHWLFRPAMARPGPEEFQTYLDVNFSLRVKKVGQLPERPEQDLTRQVRPPEVLERPESSAKATSVRLRLLVSPEGGILDSQVLRGRARYVAEARELVAHWKFRPARWGAISVPWYLDVEVPVEGWPAAQATAGAGGC